jgi:hypothetical protein
MMGGAGRPAISHSAMSQSMNLRGLLVVERYPIPPKRWHDRTPTLSPYDMT